MAAGRAWCRFVGAANGGGPRTARERGGADAWVQREVFDGGALQMWLLLYVTFCIDRSMLLHRSEHAAAVSNGQEPCIANECGGTDDEWVHHSLSTGSFTPKDSSQRGKVWAQIVCLGAIYR